MKKIHTCQILVVALMGLTCQVMAADPFQVSVQLLSSNSTFAVTAPTTLKELRGASDGLPTVAPGAKAGRRTLAVQVEIPPLHWLYADQFRVEVPAPARLIQLFLPAPKKQADPLSGENTLVFTNSFKALYAIENLNTNRLPVTVRWQGCNQTVCFLPAAETFVVAWTDPSLPRLRRAGRTPSSGTVPAVNTAAFASTIPADWRTDNWRALTNRFVLVAHRAGYLSVSKFLAFLESAKGQGGAMPETLLDR